jgi:hypothetical protein
MDYPLADFLRDYDDWSHPAIPLPKDRTSEQFFGLLVAFFHLHYADEKIARSRCKAFRKIIALIWNSQAELIDAGLMGAHATGAAIVPPNLLAAAHDLMLVRKLEQPTIEELQESMKKFEGLRDSNA